MRTVTLTALLLLVGSIGKAQWHKIADFGGQQEYITCVYFLDLPGPPRIGFVGTGTNLYKTTNGGNSWTRVWGKGYYSLYYVTDICFKDSLTGWFAVFGDTDACYRTTDGGETWKEIYSSPNGGGVYYSQDNGSLFLALETGGLQLSKDFGDTWKPLMTDSSIGDPIFLSSSIAVAPGSEHSPCDTCNSPDTNHGIFRSSDSGLNWQYIHILAPEGLGPGLPLKAGNSGTCFAASDVEGIVWRSDDFGVTWQQIAELNGPYCTGFIKGTLSHLSIQTDSGMYVSTDSGVTWRNDGGPTYITNFSNDNFYSAKGVTIAGMTYNGGGVDDGGGLWEEIWPQSGVTQAAAPAGAEISVYPNPTTGVVTISGASGAVVVENVLGEAVLGGNSTGTTPQPPPLPIRSRGGGVTLDLSGLPAGTYFVRVETAGGLQVRKVIKE